MTKAGTKPSEHQIADAIERIMQLGRGELVTHWQKAFGQPPPKYLSTSFMQKALIHDRQIRTCGPLPAHLERSLKAVTHKRKSGRPAHPPQIAPGTHLVREWNGKPYHITVTKTGFVLNEREFRSLSALATHITGTRWSGPRFFALHKPQRTPNP